MLIFITQNGDIINASNFVSIKLRNNTHFILTKRDGREEYLGTYSYDSAKKILTDLHTQFMDLGSTGSPTCSIKFPKD